MTDKRPACDDPEVDDAQPSKRPAEGVRMSADQQEVFDIVAKGKSIFFTGNAGSGKSFLLQRIYEDAVDRYGKKHVALTSLTGVSAVNIGGRTLHSWAGIQTGTAKLNQLLEMVHKNFSATAAWRSADILIIDEISMLNGSVFTNLDYIAKDIRDDNRPFGGIQVIASGDFYQLPPINKEGGYCFQSKAWTELFGNMSRMLVTPHRQSGDRRYMELLDEFREGRLSPAATELLRSRIVPVAAMDSLRAPRVVPLRRRSQFNRQLPTADEINEERLSQLPGKEVIFTMNRSSDTTQMAYDSLKLKCNAPERLVLKPGARIMLTVNLSTELDLCNGSLGEIKDIGNSPVVKFDNGITKVIDRHTWTTEDIHGNITASISQFPLILAWAVTIHKIQGSTLDSAAVSITGCFDDGQEYVALSRTRTLDGLWIDAVPRPRIPNHIVSEFYRTITRCGTQ